MSMTLLGCSDPKDKQVYFSDLFGKESLPVPPSMTLDGESC